VLTTNQVVPSALQDTTLKERDKKAKRFDGDENIEDK